MPFVASTSASQRDWYDAQIAKSGTRFRGNCVETAKLLSCPDRRAEAQFLRAIESVTFVDSAARWAIDPSMRLRLQPAELGQELIRLDHSEVEIPAVGLAVIEEAVALPLPRDDLAVVAGLGRLLTEEFGA